MLYLECPGAREVSMPKASYLVIFFNISEAYAFKSSFCNIDLTPGCTLLKTYVQLEGLCTATNPTPPEIPKKNPVHSPVPTYAVEK